MQKQKTIAKWLAVILLVTVAIACYIVLDAIFIKNQNDNQNVADAKQDDTPSSEDDANMPSDIIPMEPILPTYSNLPRKCENIGNMQVAHVGGEGDEKVLDSLYCFGKTLIVFSSTSEQYDVKQSGIYIGVYEDMTLTKVVRVCDLSTTYLKGVQTSGGLLIATCNENSTVLTLYDDSFSITCQSNLPCAKSIYFSTNSQVVTAFIYDGKFLKCATLNSSLDAIVTNFMFESNNLSVESVIQYGTKTLLFCNHSEGATVLSYTQNNGFIKHNQYDKHSIEQIMPILQSGQQAFVLLMKTPKSHLVISLDDTLKQNAIYTLDETQNAHLYQAENGINIVCDNSIINLCSHLDFISSTQLQIEDENGNISNEFSKEVTRFLSIENYSDFLAVYSQNIVSLYKKSDSTFKQILSFETSEIPLFIKGKNSQNQEYIKAFFNANLQNSFAYTCFGNFDVFAICILTSKIA